MPKYNPNPLFPNEPLFEIHDFSELPKSPRYTLYCNGQEQTVYHTDSFDYAIVVRRDDAPVSVEVCVSDSFKKAVLRPQSLEIPFDREENHIRFSLPYKAKVSLELDNDLKRPLLILSSCLFPERTDLQCRESGVKVRGKRLFRRRLCGLRPYLFEYGR